jgi:hypothetical protein
MTILEAMDDPALFASAFTGPTWDRWKVFLAAVFGLPLTAPGLPPDALAIYRQHTGREAPPGPAREVWTIAGRRGGKTRIAALLAVYLACFRTYRLAPGETGVVMVIAVDKTQAKVCFDFIRAFIAETPLLASLLVAETAETLTLANRVRVEVRAGDFRRVRGVTLVGCVLDEVAFLRDESSALGDVELYRALLPAMATQPTAMLVGISSPYWQRGLLYERFRRHWGVEAGDVLVWKAASREMNPSLPEALITEALEADEAAARAEYLAEWRTDVEAFLSREVLDACTVRDRHEIPPLGQVRHVAFTDPSGGSADAWTLAIAHGEKRGTDWIAVLDCLREAKPPFSPEQVVQDFADVLKRYKVTAVVGDRYGGEFPRELFAKHGIRYEPSERTKADIYLEALYLFTSHGVELLEDRRLHVQLLGLERRTARGGRDSVDHPPRGHDDLANAAAGALLLASDGPGTAIPQVTGELARPYQPVDWHQEFPEERGMRSIRDEFGDRGDR